MARASVFLYVLLTLSVMIAVAVALSFGRQVYNSVNLHRAVKSAMMPKGSVTAPVVVYPSPSSSEDHHSAFLFATTLMCALQSSGSAPPLAPPGCISLMTFGGRNNAWLLATSPAEVWLVFRGTATKTEWRQNLHMQQVAFAGGNVHKGFSRAYISMRAAIDSALTRLNPRVVNVVGYSLGAALAQLCVVDLSGIPQLNLIAIASPRVGDVAFAKLVPHKLHSKMLLLNTSDIVCDLPLAVHPNATRPNLPFTYQHPHFATFFNTNHGSWKANHDIATYRDQAFAIF